MLPNLRPWTFWRSLWLFELPLKAAFKLFPPLSQHPACQWIGSSVWKRPFPSTTISTCQHGLACTMTACCDLQEWWFDSFWWVSSTISHLTSSASRPRSSKHFCSLRNSCGETLSTACVAALPAECKKYFTRESAERRSTFPVLHKGRGNVQELV